MNSSYTFYICINILSNIYHFFIFVGLYLSMYNIYNIPFSINDNKTNTVYTEFTIS